MKQEEKNTLLAKADGWKLEWRTIRGKRVRRAVKKAPGAVHQRDTFFNYFEDLNATHELVAARCNNSKDGAEFGRWLVKIVLGYDFWTMPVAHQVLNHWELCRLADATAAQRAEALGKTLNLW